MATTNPNVTTFNNTGLTTGTTYYYRVRAEGLGGNSVFSDVLTVPLTAPAAPTGVTAYLWNAGSIDFSWLDNATTEVGYRLQRAPSGGSTFTTVPGCDLGPDNQYCSDTTNLVVGATYQYRVVAYNLVGATNSAVLNFTYAKPAAPSNLAATIVSGTRIDLTWVNSGTNQSATFIDVWEDGTWTRSVYAARGVSSASDTGLTAGKTYTYQAYAYNGLDWSGYSNQVVVPLIAPPAPQGLSAAVVSATRVDLGWQDTPNESSYKVERQNPGSTSWASVSGCSALGTNVITCSDTNGLASGNTYKYRVTATNPVGSTISASVDAPVAKPANPSNLGGEVTGLTQVTLRWVDNSATETGFKIERASGATGTSFSQIGTTGANVATYVDNGRTAGSGYNYRVRAYNGVDNSDYSNTYGPTVGPPTAPVLSWAKMGPNLSVDLEWTDPNIQETGYIISRQIGSGSFGDLPILAKNTKTFRDPNLTAGSTYTYRVRARNGAGDSANSGTISVPMVAPNAPVPERPAHRGYPGHADLGRPHERGWLPPPALTRQHELGCADGVGRQRHHLRRQHGGGQQHLLLPAGGVQRRQRLALQQRRDHHRQQADGARWPRRLSQFDHVRRDELE